MVDLSILEEINKAAAHGEDLHEEKEDIKHIGLIGLDREIEMKKIEIRNLTNVYENIKKSERLRCKINKEFINGAAIEDILLMAIECISLMTGDVVFYKQNKKYLEKITS